MGRLWKKEVVLSPKPAGKQSLYPLNAYKPNPSNNPNVLGKGF